ncbi:MAG: lysostaphin resistance A-like protein [Longimicrobiales bacterium]
MSLMATEVPADRIQRLIWVGSRVFGWFVVFTALELVGGLVYDRLGLPASDMMLLLRTAVTVIAAVVAGVIMLHWLDHRPPADLGFPLQSAAFRQFGWGFIIGCAALTLAAVLIALSGWLAFRTDDGTAAHWVAIMARDFGLLGVAAAAEEAVFRGYPFQVLARAAGAPMAVLLGSGLFTWAHAQNPNVSTFALINIFLAGVWLATAFLVTRSLWFATALHLGWNWSMASLLDLPVSGLEMFDTPLYEPVLSGPTWFTGGAFGPEGGLTGTVALGAGLAAVWAYSRRQPTVGVS